MAPEKTIPHVGKQLEDPRKAIKELSRNIFEKVKNIPKEKLETLVLYTIALMKEQFHIDDEEKALCYLLKNTSEAFGEENDIVC